MSRLQRWTRWILAVPAGILAAVVVSFSVHWFVMVNLGGWAIEPVIEIGDPATLRQIEQFLQALFGPLALVYCASRTVPNHSRMFSFLLTCVLVFGVPLLALLWNSHVISSGQRSVLEYGFLQVLANAMGASAAMYLIHLRCGKYALCEKGSILSNDCVWKQNLEIAEEADSVTSTGLLPDSQLDLPECANDSTITINAAADQPRFSGSPMLIAIAVLILVLGMNASTDVIVIVLCALLLATMVHQVGIVLAVILAGAIPETVEVFYGSKLATVRAKGITLALGWIPLGGAVRLCGAESVHLGKRHRTFEDLGLNWRWAIVASGPIAVFLLASLCIGPDEAARSVFRGFSQVVKGAMSPLSTGPAMLAYATSLLRVENFTYALGMVSAKMVAIHLLPFPSMNGGQFIMEVLRHRVKEGTDAFIMLLGVLCTTTILALWCIAACKALISGLFAICSA